MGKHNPKRGKDIKCFADLPPGIQRNINNLSSYPDGTMDEAEKAKRTAAAIEYHNLFLGRYEPQGIGTMAQAKRAGAKCGVTYKADQIHLSQSEADQVRLIPKRVC